MRGAHAAVRQRAARRARASFCSGVPMLMRSASPSRGAARMSRTTMPAASRRSNAACGIVEAHQQEVGRDGYTRRRPASVMQRRAGVSRSRRTLAMRCLASRRSAAGASARNASSTHGAGSGYGAWQRCSTAISSGVGDHAADPRRGQRVGLGQRAQHDDVGVRREQRNRRRLLGVLDVGLVDHHQRAAFELSRQRARSRPAAATCRRDCRRAQEHQLRAPLATAASATAAKSQCESVVAIAQRHLDHARAVQPRAHRVHAERRRRDQRPRRARAADRAHQQVDGLVAAAAGQQLRRLAAVQLGQCRAQRRRLRIRIAAQAGVGIGSVRPRRLVGIEPDASVECFAARRAVAGEIAQVFAHQVDDACSCGQLLQRAARTARRCASRPSAVASSTAHGPIAAGRAAAPPAR